MEAPRNKAVITIKPINRGRVTSWKVTCSDHDLKQQVARDATQASQMARGHASHSHGDDVIYRRPR